ncbi:ATP-dependent DNA helicase, partial [Lactobacillus delbrueckii subsp. lactis]|nr:ATP-dependent DNA helicase [Lactobacillus delbrueckii subsp. lactis]
MLFVCFHTNQIRYLLEQEKDRFLTDEESLLEELNDQVDLLEFYTGKSYQLADLLNQPLLDHLGFVVNVTNPEDALSSNLYWLSLDSSEELHKIYNRFDHISMISATITNDGNFAFAKQFLALPN